MRKIYGTSKWIVQHSLLVECEKDQDDVIDQRREFPLLAMWETIALHHNGSGLKILQWIQSGVKIYRVLNFPSSVCPSFSVDLASRLTSIVFLQVIKAQPCIKHVISIQTSTNKTKHVTSKLRSVFLYKMKSPSPMKVNEGLETQLPLKAKSRMTQVKIKTLNRKSIVIDVYEINYIRSAEIKSNEE